MMISHNSGPRSAGGLARLRRHMRLCSALALLAMAPLTLSCYGRFPLTRLVYRVNGEIGDSITDDPMGRRFAQSVVMWVFVIIPVYGIATLADAIVLNAIEFWSGNPVQVGEHVAPDGTRIAVVPAPDGRTASLTVTAADGTVLARERLVKVSAARLEVRQENGRLAGTIERNVAGDMILKDAAGRTVSTIPAAQAPAGAVF